MKPQNAPEPEPKPGVIVGDEIFFRHEKGDCSAHVAATGKHGVTVKSGGKHRKVKWENVLGHKKRAAQHFNVVEPGEDGHLVKDAAGVKRYIHIPNEARADPLVTKAIEKGRGLKKGHPVRFKIGDDDNEGVIVGRPGLHGAHVKDSTGRVHQVRWKELAKGQRSGS